MFLTSSQCFLRQVRIIQNSQLTNIFELFPAHNEEVDDELIRHPRLQASSRIDLSMAESTHWLLTLSCKDGPGIVHAISSAIVAANGNITESQQFTSEVGLIKMTFA